MPACPRRQIVPRGEVGVFHLWNRCVQRAFLCDRDPATGKNYEYRRAWIEDLERRLASLFAIEVSHHAELKNHIHVVVRTRPDVAQTWDDRGRRAAVADHHPHQTLRQPEHRRTERETHRDRNEQAGPRGRVAAAVVRCFLVDGHTVREHLPPLQQGFRHQRGLLGASLQVPQPDRRCVRSGLRVYVDLNVIRAGEALTPEESRHTSVYNRIEGLKWREAREQGAAEESGARGPGRLALRVDHSDRNGSRRHAGQQLSPAGLRQRAAVYLPREVLGNSRLDGASATV